MARSTKKSSHVPGQYLGYSLQATRVTARLFDAGPCWKVSLEVVDDVGIETENGDFILEQNKSTHGRNPVSDRAVDLWKTFANWFEVVKRDELDPKKTQFILYISEQKSGNIVSKLHAAKSRKEAKLALQEAMNMLWGQPKEFKQKVNVASELAPHLECLFKPGNEGLRNKLLDIICNFSLMCGDVSPQEDLRAICQKSLVADELVDDLLCHAQGWVKEQIDTKLEKGESAIIDRDEFRNEMVAYHHRMVNQSILRSVSPPPDITIINQQLEQTFIRQLDLINCEDDHKLHAAKCWLQAAADRTAWSVQGLVTKQDFQELESDLIQVWEHHKMKTQILGEGKTECNLGKLLYAECAIYKARIQGMEVPYHFTPGSFHSLANAQNIGWHPKYKELLRS